MNAQELERFRIALLTVAEVATARYGLGVAAFKLHVAAFGFDRVSLDEVRREVDYLVDKGFLAEAPKTVSPENRIWRITASGRDWKAQNE